MEKIMNNSYINKDEINNKIYDYIAGYINCSTDQLKEEGTHFVKNKKAAKNYVKILSIRDTNIISLSEEKYELGKQLLSGKTRDELYEGNNLKTLCDIEGFENSLAFDAEGNTNTTIVLCAIKDNEIIAIAGAAPTGKLMEVGIDVKKKWRGYGLARLLVRNLTVEILERNMIPFYSASVTNLASQAVAIRSGYMPLWTDSFGTR
jgi:Leucine-rich repeat (LRR) protein